MLKDEAIEALNSGQLADTLITGINISWIIIAIGIPIFGMIIYRYILISLADRLILFISNKAWTDKGKLVEFKGERWIIEELGLFRVSLTKAATIKNRGKNETMKKTLTIPISKYLEADIVYYEYKDLYNEQNILASEDVD